MKQKNKKILKTLGVGALCLCGALTFSGCAMDLSQEQIDKLMFAVDNSQGFMQDTLDLLEKQNAKMDAEQAYALCRLAYQKIFQNYQGLRDDLMIEIFNGDNEELIQTLISYSINNNDIIINVDKDGTYVMFEDGEKQYGYYEEGSKTTKEELIENIHYLNNWYSFDMIGLLGLTSKDIVSCEILSNGNYNIVFVYSYLDEEDSIQTDDIINVEITSAGEYVEINVCSSYQDFAERFLEQGKMKVNFKYGAADKVFVENIMNKAKKAPIICEIISGSMAPTFTTGDMVKITAKEQYIVGDIIKFYYQELPVVHRIIGIVEDGSTGKTYYVCKGDAVGSSNPANNNQVVSWEEDSTYVSTLTYEQIMNGDAINVQVIELSQIEGIVTLIGD